ncbi:hypothetical protein AVEN_104347-1 [Araneus ventricosus]|uniref:Uncharacterized protein n=1 Tax=Araneus ventricosus TaxID=182803 RepID=A0A4Y2BXT3_ARAVE|nr:hypothetical protein AVEN_104347-1 [Araneus ventricosus]
MTPEVDAYHIHRSTTRSHHFGSWSDDEDRTPPHGPVPDAITADMLRIERRPTPDAVTATEPVEWTWDKMMRTAP